MLAAWLTFTFHAAGEKWADRADPPYPGRGSWIEEVPGVNAQERMKEALMKSLREILIEALEFNRAEAGRS